VAPAVGGTGVVMSESHSREPQPASSRVARPGSTPSLLLVFAALAAVFAKGLFSGDASKVPSALIGKPAPAITLLPLEGLQRDGQPVPSFSMADLAGARRRSSTSSRAGARPAGSSIPSWSQWPNRRR
jgi:hypothetical protein